MSMSMSMSMSADPDCRARRTTWTRNGSAAAEHSRGADWHSAANSRGTRIHSRSSDSSWHEPRERASEMQAPAIGLKTRRSKKQAVGDRVLHARVPMCRLLCFMSMSADPDCCARRTTWTRNGSAAAGHSRGADWHSAADSRGTRIHSRSSDSGWHEPRERASEMVRQWLKPNGIMNFTSSVETAD